MGQNNINNQLIEQLRRKEKEAVKKLYDMNFRNCVKMVLSDKGTFSDAEEVFQSAIYSLILKLENPDFTIKSSLFGYIKQTCFNIWVKTKVKNQKKVELDPRMEILDEATTPYIAAQKDATMLKMRQCLKKVTDSCRQLLEYTFFEKLSDKEIAPLMGLQLNFVRVKRHRCIAAMKKCMEK